VERQVTPTKGRRAEKPRMSWGIGPSGEGLAGLVRESRCTVALTGAGVSVPSGIPDFRTPRLRT